MAKPTGELFLFAEKNCEINNVSPQQWVKMEITVDSGSCETVIPDNMITHVTLHQSPGSKAGKKYEAANGSDLNNLGERRCVVATDDIHKPLIMHFQVSEVTKPLLSVTKAADMGFEAVLGKH